MAPIQTSSSRNGFPPGNSLTTITASTSSVISTLAPSQHVTTTSMSSRLRSIPMISSYKKLLLGARGDVNVDKFNMMLAEDINPPNLSNLKLNVECNIEVVFFQNSV
eukprot:TRINITY_DN6985_c0_g1_i10.p1 TRINITY_DN6985_c0_g1~~TRINITY_DN6985_c0_g1_i10.p1  ORF type:complete len:107 (+),score=2.24 TRINITY_DN6985_c0_g1_i10:89-409(+)